MVMGAKIGGKNNGGKNNGGKKDILMGFPPERHTDLVCSMITGCGKDAPAAQAMHCKLAKPWVHSKLPAITMKNDRPTAMLITP